MRAARRPFRARLVLARGDIPTRFARTSASMSVGWTEQSRALVTTRPKLKRAPMPKRRGSKPSTRGGRGGRGGRGRRSSDDRGAVASVGTRRKYTAEEIINWQTSDDDDEEEDDGMFDDGFGVSGLRPRAVARGRGRGRGARPAAATAVRKMTVGGVEVFLDRGGGGSPPAGLGAGAAVGFDYNDIDGGMRGGGGDDEHGEPDEVSASSSEDESEDWSDGSIDDDVALDYMENISDGSDEGDEDDYGSDELDELAGLGSKRDQVHRMNDMMRVLRMDLEGSHPEPPSSRREGVEVVTPADFDADDDVWSRLFSAAIDAGVSYIGFPPVKSSMEALSLEEAQRIAKRHQCDMEIKGGGKRRHAVLHLTSGSRAMPVESHSFLPKQTRRKNVSSRQRSRRVKPAPQFVSGGLANDTDVFSESESADDAMDAPAGGVDESEVVYPNRGSRRAAEAQRRDAERLERARSKKRGTVVGAGHEFGAFERHTTGFGSRMLAKMGFKGTGGLGKARDGIAEPVAAITRGKRVGLGAYGSEKLV